ncbi:MAG: hypothetical protein AB7Q97_25115 [Gammaproteobacteria bacterium]
MRPRLDELIDAIRWTFAQHVVPTVEEPLARSYCKTIAALLDQAHARAVHEAAALLAERDELRALLEQAGAEAEPAGSAALARSAPRDGEHPDLPELNAQVAALRSALVAVQSRLTGPARERLHAYFAHQLDRDDSCIPAIAGRAF